MIPEWSLFFEGVARAYLYLAIFALIAVPLRRAFT